MSNPNDESVEVNPGFIEIDPNVMNNQTISAEDDIRMPAYSEPAGVSAEEPVEPEALAEGAEAAEEVLEEQPEKEYKNAQGYIRRLERENHIMLDRMDALGRHVEYLRQAEEQKQRAAMQQNEEVVPDPDLDPIGAVYRELKDLKKKYEDNEKRMAIEAQRSTMEAALAHADAQITQVAAVNPPLFEAAVAHLARVVKEDIEDRFPNKTNREQLAIANQAIKALKIQWVQQGKNPGEEYLKRAVRSGFRPDEFISQGNQQRPPQGDKTAVEKIAREKARDGKVRTVATLDGAAPKAPRSGRDYLKMSEFEFNEYINRGMKEGTMAKEHGKYGRTPKFSDLLPGKGVRVP